MQVDLHQHYGIDVYDERLLRSRPWAWLESRIIGLIAIEGSRVRNWFFPPKQPNLGRSTTTGR